MTNEEKKIVNPDMIPTKELLKQQQKKEYQKLKEKRKKDRLLAKEEKEDLRKQERDEKDQALWSQLKKATQITPSVPQKEKEEHEH